MKTVLSLFKDKEVRKEAKQVYKETGTLRKTAKHFDCKLIIIRILAILENWDIWEDTDKLPFNTKEKILKAKYLYFKKEYTYSQIASKFDTTKVTVKNLFKTIGWKARDRSKCQLKDKLYTEEKIKFYKNLYLKKGWSFDKIGKEYKVTPDKISQIANREGWILTKQDRSDKGFIPKGEKHPSRLKKLELLQSKYCRNYASYGAFACMARYVSNIIYRKYKTIINAKKLKRSKRFHLDHKFSIWEAFYNTNVETNPIKIKELCHPCNLQVIHFSKNSRKNKSCSITLKELRREIKKFNKDQGDPFESLNIKVNLIKLDKFNNDMLIIDER